MFIKQILIINFSPHYSSLDLFIHTKSSKYMGALNFFQRDRLCKWGDGSYSSWSNDFRMKLASSCCVVSSGATVCWLSSLL